MMLKTYLRTHRDRGGGRTICARNRAGHLRESVANVVTTTVKAAAIRYGQIGKSRDAFAPSPSNASSMMEMEPFVEPATAKEWHQY